MRMASDVLPKPFFGREECGDGDFLDLLMDWLFMALTATLGMLSLQFHAQDLVYRGTVRRPEQRHGG